MGRVGPELGQRRHFSFNTNTEALSPNESLRGCPLGPFSHFPNARARLVAHCWPEGQCWNTWPQVMSGEPEIRAARSEHRAISDPGPGPVLWVPAPQVCTTHGSKR